MTNPPLQLKSGLSALNKNDRLANVAGKLYKVMKVSYDISKLEKELEQLFSKETFVEFDVCMLSYNLLDGKDSKYPFLTKVYDAQTASGYIVNHTIYDALIELYEESAYMLERTQMHWIYTNDQSWKILQPQNNWYCFKKRMGKQRPGFSEIGQKYTQPQY